jgi:hypothetical protein
MPARPALRSLGTFAVALVVYFATPVGELPSGIAAVVSVLGLIAGTVLLAALIIGQVRREVRAEGEDKGVRVQTLLVLVYVTVLVFALGYFMLDQANDNQFAGLGTKVDSLYFTMATLATVGFGDVHATGQVARALVTAQMVFDVLFVGLLASTLTSKLRRRANAIHDRTEEV